MRTPSVLTVCIPALLLATACNPPKIVLEDIDTETEELGTDGDTTVDETTDTDATTDESTDSTDTTDTTDTTEDTSAWDNATLRILSPASGDFLPWGEPSEFSAVVYDADGAETDFVEIVWTSDIDSAWAVEGAAFSDDALDIGEHALTATAVLPNGDRLAYSIGGLLVQSEYAGTYTGAVSIDGAYTEFAVGCEGPAVLYIDAYGEEAWGDASCLISLLGFDVDMAFLFEMENDEGELEGDANVDISGFFELPFDIDAELNEDGEISTDFELDYGDLAVSGGMELTRISRETLEP